MQESFGEYKVLERVGAGSTAEVFRARDTRAGRTAAIKVLTSDVAIDPVRGQPIADEAFLAISLGHPNAAALYEVGEQDGRPYLVYEFIQGQTLRALVGGHPINPRHALEFAAQIADTLADAHAIGLVHRSLRPENIVVSQKGTAKTTDFGLGRYATAVAQDMAARGATVPAMAYWAPEQRTGEADQRSDIYTLGLILVEMLTGRLPGGSPSDAPVAPLIAPLVGRMLEPSPERRIDAAATVAAQLRELAATLEAQRNAPAAPAAPPPEAASPTRRPPAPAAVPATPAPAPAPRSGKRASKGVVVSKPAPPTAPGDTPAVAAGPSGRAADPARKGGQPPRSQPQRPAERPRPGAPAAPKASAPSATVWLITAAVAGVAAVLWFLLAR